MCTCITINLTITLCHCSRICVISIPVACNWLNSYWLEQVPTLSSSRGNCKSFMSKCGTLCGHRTLALEKCQPNITTYKCTKKHDHVLSMSDLLLFNIKWAVFVDETVYKQWIRQVKGMFRSDS